VADADAGHIGNRVVGPRLEQPGPDTQIARARAVGVAALTKDGPPSQSEHARKKRR
jgi:hypothetical protein